MSDPRWTGEEAWIAALTVRARFAFAHIKETATEPLTKSFVRAQARGWFRLIPNVGRVTEREILTAAQETADEREEAQYGHLPRWHWADRQRDCRFLEVPGGWLFHWNDFGTGEEQAPAGALCFVPYPTTYQPTEDEVDRRFLPGMEGADIAPYAPTTPDEGAP